jgi:hypothetical protein
LGRNKVVRISLANAAGPKGLAQARRREGDEVARVMEYADAYALYRDDIEYAA